MGGFAALGFGGNHMADLMVLGKGKVQVVAGSRGSNLAIICGMG